MTCCFDTPGMPAGAHQDSSQSDMTMKEKQNETHQIMKENLELKAQMERGRIPHPSHPMSDEDRRKYEHQQYEYQRMYLMQQQQMAQRRHLQVCRVFTDVEIYSFPWNCPENYCSVTSDLPK